LIEHSFDTVMLAC